METRFMPVNNQITKIYISLQDPTVYTHQELIRIF